MMNKKGARCTFALCFFGVLAVIFKFSPYATLANEEDETDIVIYHTNDMHGNVNSVWNDGKLARIGLDVIKSAKKNTPNSILIDAGDAIWGTQFAKHKKGLDIIDMMNAVGYDGMTVGNHEFEYGSDELLNCVRRANFPVVSANIYKNGDVFLEGINESNGESFIIERSGRRIGFFGITTEETKRIIVPSKLDGIEFRDEIETARLQIKKLKEQNVDLIVAIAHVGVDISSKTTSRDIAKNLSGIDIIIDGHSHTEFIGEENGTIISQTGIGLSNVGKITVKFTKNKPKIRASLISANDLGCMFQPDDTITKMYGNIYSEISPSLERIVGKISNNLYGGTYNGTNISRLTETSMGDFICDAMLRRGKKILKDTDFRDLPVVAFENGGAVRSTINSGYVKMDNIYSIFPLDNRLSVQIITPSILYRVLEQGVGKLISPKSSGEPFAGPFGGFPQVCGIKVEIDPTLEPYDYVKNTSGKRITKVTIVNPDGSSGRELFPDDNETRIAFLFNDHALYEYAAIKDEEIVMKDNCLYDIIADYMSELTYENDGEFSYPCSNNRIIINQDFFQNVFYSPEIVLKDKTGELSMATASVAVDGKDLGFYTSDEDAKIIVKDLASGAHTIKITHGGLSRELYVNNEVGMCSNTADFANDFDKDIISVSNLIGQIPYDITAKDEQLIKFARISYDELSEEQKSKILNYNKLQSAEEEIRVINGQNLPDRLISKLNHHSQLLMFMALFVFGTGIIVIFLIRRNKVKTNQNP